MVQRNIEQDYEDMLDDLFSEYECGNISADEYYDMLEDIEQSYWNEYLYKG